MLERDTLASGSTSKAAGGIRMQFADELNIRIALRSLDEFERFGADISFRQYGYLFLLTREEDVEAFRAALALQQSLGVPSRELTPAEGRRPNPAGTIDTTTVTRSTLPSLRTTWVSWPLSTKPCPAVTTCGEHVGSSAM